MKFYFSKSIILALVVFLISGCGTSKISSNTSNEKPKVSAPKESQTDLSSNKATMIITNHEQQPESIKNKSTIVLGESSATEYVELIIQGGIKDFEYVTLEWDENYEKSTDKSVINKMPELKDTTVVIRTVLPEGIPQEKIKWKSLSGKDYEYVISAKGLDGIEGNAKIINMQ